jgi:hypothetical protein
LREKLDWTKGKQGKKKKKKQPDLLLYFNKDPLLISGLPIDVRISLQD